MKRLLSMMVFMAILLTGCWDAVEIDKRAFVLGAAVDVAPESTQGQGMEDIEKGNSNRFMLTVEIPIFRLIAAKGSGGGMGGNGQQPMKPTWVFSSTGSSFLEIERQMATRSDRRLFFAHQKALIIGEELARKYDLNKVLDFWSREPESRYDIKVLISEGPAKDILNAQPKLAQSASMFIKDQMDQSAKTARFMYIDLQDFLRELAAGADTLVGRISISEDKDLKIAGSGVIKDGKLKGWLNEQETHAAQFVAGKVKGGEIVIEDPQRLGGSITFEIYSVNRSFEADFKDDKPSLTIKIRMEGNIAEINGDIGAIDQQTINMVQQGVSQKLEYEIKYTIDKLQKQYKADALGFGQYLEKHHYKQWKKIEKRWDEIYPDMPVSIKVDTEVRRTGMKY